MASPISLDVARENLQIWIDAERAVATGAEYSIGTRRLKRADLSQIAERINYWSAMVAALERGNKMRVVRAVPRDF